MNINEFSNEFDVLINSNAGAEAFGHEQNPFNFDEYEKSVHLSNAQEQLVRELYSGATGFESTEQVRRYLSPLIETAELSVEKYPQGISANSKRAFLPDDLMFITLEAAKIAQDIPCFGGKTIEVIPVAQDEYHRIIDNPFRGSNSRRVLRLDTGVNTVELISMYNLDSYQVRYIKRPEPIILVDLPEELSIGYGVTKSYNKKRECKLNPDLHRMILDIAVQNAIKSRSQGKSN